MKKIKIVWLCHFANEKLKNYFSKPNVREFSPWISNLIELFEKSNDIALHIIVPNVFTNTNCSFELEGIAYHCFSFYPKWLPRKIYNYSGFGYLTNYYFIRMRIAKIIKNINPDLIHLHGAENPYYSIGILPAINKIPILLSVQGFVRNATFKNRVIKYRIALEQKIINKVKHIGVRTTEMSETIMSLNPNAELHFHNYPISIPKISKSENDIEEYDLVFFARLTKDKGIEDLIEALAIVQKIIPDVLLCVIGGTSKSYMIFLKETILRLGLVNNIKFVGFIKDQQELFRIAVKAKIYVLPTHHDIIPGTIIECMFMKIPVISYAVGGIPEINKEDENIVLVPKGEINTLAEKIIQLLEDPFRQKSLRDKAFRRASEMFNNNRIMADIMDAYKIIIDDFQVFGN